MLYTVQNAFWGSSKIAPGFISEHHNSRIVAVNPDLLIYSHCRRPHGKIALTAGLCFFFTYFIFIFLFSSHSDSNTTVVLIYITTGGPPLRTRWFLFFFQFIFCSLLSLSMRSNEPESIDPLFLPVGQILVS